MSLKWVDCDLPAQEERTPEQIRKRFCFLVLPFRVPYFHSPPLVDSRQLPILHNKGGHLAPDRVDAINLTLELQLGART